MQNQYIQDSIEIKFCADETAQAMREGTKEHILTLFNSVKENSDTDNKPLTIGFLTEEGVKYLADISGIKIKPITRFTISLSTLRHWYKNHYGANEKDTGNNNPLNDNDIKSVVDVITNPNKILFMGYNKQAQANEFVFLKSNINGTYSLLEVYSNSDGELKPKTFYYSKKDIGGQVMNLLKKLPTPNVRDAHTHY